MNRTKILTIIGNDKHGISEYLLLGLLSSSYSTWYNVIVFLFEDEWIIRRGKPAQMLSPENEQKLEWEGEILGKSINHDLPSISH